MRRKSGRSPHGERGLKSNQTHSAKRKSLSLPPRGAWIEMVTRSTDLQAVIVAPPTGSVD